jgi:hypothetical protein
MEPALDASYCAIKGECYDWPQLDEQPLADVD